MSDGEATCSSCGAIVKAPPGATKCPYCGMHVDIPVGTTAASGGGAPPAANPFAEEERWQPQQREAERRRDSSPPPSSSSSSSAGSIVVVVIIVAAVALVAAIVVAGMKSKKKTDARAERKSSAAYTSKTTAKTSPPTPAYVDSIPITSCRCVFGDGQSTPQVTLTLRAAPTSDPSRAVSLGIERVNGFMTETKSVNFTVPDGAVFANAPPPRLGVACDTGVYALVADKTVTGWSSVNGQWKWTATLPSSMVDGADASVPPPTPGTTFTSSCSPLSVQNGTMSVALANGKHASVSLRDGKLK